MKRLNDKSLVRPMVVVAAIFCLASLSFAGSPKRTDTGNYAPTFEQALMQARQTGQPVLAVFMDYRNTCPITGGWYDSAVCGGSTRSFLVCEESIIHVNANRFTDPFYQVYRRKISGNYIPYFAFVAPDGQFIAGGDGKAVESGQFNKIKADIIRNYPPIPAQRVRQSQDLLDQAGVLIDACQYQSADRLIQQAVARMWYPQSLLDHAKAISAFRDRQAKQQLQEAEASLKAGQIDQAMQTCDRILACFGATCDEGRAASKSQRQMLTDHRDAVLAYQKQAPELAAQWYWQRAQSLADKQRHAAALEVCRTITKRYPHTELLAKINELSVSLTETIKRQKTEEARDASGQPQSWSPYLPVGCDAASSPESASPAKTGP